MISQLTKVLVGLYEEPERPANAIDYIKKFLGAPTGEFKKPLWTMLAFDGTMTPQHAYDAKDFQNFLRRRRGGAAGGE